MPPTYTVQARHIDTCLPDYLQDHHNRDGECLIGIEPCGQTAEQAAGEAMDTHLDADNCPPLEHVTDEAIKAALIACLGSVDLRHIDGTGGHVDIPADNTRCIGCGGDCGEDAARCNRCNDGENAYVWILLTWTRTDEGADECVTCGARFNATHADKHPICRACR